MRPREISTHDVAGNMWLERAGHKLRFANGLRVATRVDASSVRAASRECHDIVYSAVDLLPGQQKLSIVKRYGLDGLGERTLAQVAEEMAVSPQRVAQLEMAAFRRLRKNAAVSALLLEVQQQ